MTQALAISPFAIMALALALVIALAPALAAADDTKLKEWVLDSTNVKLNRGTERFSHAAQLVSPWDVDSCSHAIHAHAYATHGSARLVLARRGGRTSCRWIACWEPARPPGS